MARQADVRCWALILVLCFPLIQCHPIDGNSKVSNDELVDHLVDDELDDFFFDEDYGTHEAIPLGTTPLPAATSSTSSRKNLVMKSSESIITGRTAGPTGMFPISKGTTSVTNPLIASEKTFQSRLTTAPKAQETKNNNKEEIEFYEDYSAEDTDSSAFVVPIKSNGTLKNKSVYPTNFGLTKTVLQPASKASAAYILKTSKSDTKITAAPLDAEIKTTFKHSADVKTGKATDAATFQGRLANEKLTSHLKHKPMETVGGSVSNLSPANQTITAQKAAVEEPTATFSPVLIAEVTKPTPDAHQNPTTSPPIEVKQSKTATFQQAQEPSITASPVPQISAGQPANFVVPASQPMPSPTFTQTDTFTRPAGDFPLPWSGGPLVQTVPFTVPQPPFATANFIQPILRQEVGAQPDFSIVPQHPIAAHAAFQYSHVASDQQKMAMGAGPIAQQVASQSVSPSSAANSQPVHTAVGQPIWIRTKTGLSQVNLLPVSMLSHFVPTFKSTGVRIVPPTLIKAQSS